MMLFSTGTGLERVGVVGPELELPLGRNWNYRWAGPVALDIRLLCKNKKQRGIGGGSPIVTLMPKLVLPCGEKRSTV